VPCRRAEFSRLLSRAIVIELRGIENWHASYYSEPIGLSAK